MTRIDEHMPKTGRPAPLTSLPDIGEERILEETLPEEFAESGDPTFAPLSENIKLIGELRMKVDRWEALAQASVEKGKPNKGILSHAMSLNKLLVDAVANHTRMQLQLVKASNAEEQPENSRGSHTTVNVEVLNKIYSHLTDCDEETQDRTVNLLGKVRKRLQDAAVRRPARKSAQLATAEKSVE